MHSYSPHTFHIPVMGLAFTVDSPLKVARYGISSVISIAEDRLVEMMRKVHYEANQEEYVPINTSTPNYRVLRITDYLNLMNRVINEQVDKVKKSTFSPGSEIVKYFEMLPEKSMLKHLYNIFQEENDATSKAEMENMLRENIVPGSIDINIMTKVDRNTYDKAGELIDDGSDAVTALKAYVESDLQNSAIVFSAGMNPRLFNYLERCPAFDADEKGNFKKRIIIKVSDYRSALIQGKFLAKKGLWVSEFRIESGLNCGGHAFATDGFLMGPILEEFKLKREELIQALFEVYNNALLAKGKNKVARPHDLYISAQGGIGTFAEDTFLRHNYSLNSTGWGTPFLLVPEATTVDDKTLELLCRAKKQDVVLSKNSPLGVRFNYLKGTSSEKEKLQRIAKEKPGSPCTEKFLAFNTEFTKEPICTASRKYQKLKIAQLESANLEEEDFNRQIAEVLDKECLCLGLSNSASLVNDVTFIKNMKAVTICPGPNIVNFSETSSLQSMVDHIYGRKDLINNPHRPHMFITELELYVDYFKEQIEKFRSSSSDIKLQKYIEEFFSNMINGINYYRVIADEISHAKKEFVQALADYEMELNRLFTSLLVKEG